MKLSLMAARSENNVIGLDSVIPWKVEGEQLLFRAMTFNHWLIVGRTTFHSMGILPNRKYAVISRTMRQPSDSSFLVFDSVERAVNGLSEIADHAFVAGGGQVFSSCIDMVDHIHLSTIHREIAGNILFPSIPHAFRLVFEQGFSSNIDYTYQIWSRSQVR